MTVSRRLREYLDANHVDYRVLSHKVAYTAQEVAAAQGITGWHVAKPVVCNCDGKYVLVVIQAPAKVDFDRLKKEIGCNEVRLAFESEMEKLFPGVELGAESPFGNLYDLAVYVDRDLAEMPDIVFNAGSHTETIQMDYDDYARLVSPRIIGISKAVGV